MVRITIILQILCLTPAMLSGAELSPTAEDSAWKASAYNYCFQRVSDTISSLWLAHSNRMAFGRPFDKGWPHLPDVEQTENLPFSFKANFPARSRGEYLYAAGLWVGGIKGDDTLVSHAFDYGVAIPELNPLACPGGAFQTFPGWADVEHIAVGFDTIIIGDTLLRCQTGGCNDWYPLGIKVTSHSYTWESPPYDRSVIVEYTISNIDTLPFEEGWVGIYADGDAGTTSTAYSGDVSGFLDGAIDSNGNWVDLNVAYTHDLDGDPDRYGFNEYSVQGTFGVQVLGLTVPDYRVNFNWWVVDQIQGSDWAPRQRAPIIRDLGGSIATAFGDSNKYFVMSYPEVDYNQVEAGLRHHGWVDPDNRGVEAGRGGDTRFLISAGPFDLAPGEDVTFTAALIAGDHMVTNAHISSWFDPTNAMSISDYYEELRLTELRASALAALSVLQHGYDLPPPGPPADLRLVGFDDTYASLVWSRKYGRDMAGYRVMQCVAGEAWETAAVKAPEDTTAVIEGLIPDREYTFAVASYDSNGSAGKLSRQVSLLPGLPHAPQTLIGSGCRTYAQLTWSRSVDADVEAYRLYRVDIAAADTIVVSELIDTSYIDLDVVLGRTYDYYVTAVTAAGLESTPSSTARVVPMTFNSGILAVNHNIGDIIYNIVFSMSFVDSLMTRALEGMRFTYRRIDQDHPLTTYEMSQYSLVIISNENRAGIITDDMIDLLPAYLTGGGKVILIVANTGINQYPMSQPVVERFSRYSFPSKYFFIDSSYIGPVIVEPQYGLAGDLVGAAPQVDDFPALPWDSVKANQFGYALHRGLPYAGYIWPREPAEIVYRYVSSTPDSITDGQVNGIRYRGDDYSFYYFNFPMSLMKLDSAAAALRAAVIDLGEYYICGDVNGDNRFNIADIVAYIQYLYYGGQPPNMALAGDADCNGRYEMADVLILINYFLSTGLSPECCR